MTTLSIYPKFGDKTAKITGTVSAGEHVDVRIIGGASLLPSSTLRLRITCGKTIAVFPQPESNDAWATEGSDLKCHLNLNTVQAEIALRHGCVSCHALLEQTADDEHTLEPTLFFDDEFDILPWRKIPGETTPLNLDAYPDVIASFERRLNEFGAVVNQTKDLVTQAKNAAVGANNRAENAERSAQEAEKSALAAQRSLDGINSQVADARNAAVQAMSSASAASDSAAAAEEKAAEAAEVAENKADLVNGKVPASQLPSYVDDVLEYPTLSDFPATGESGKIYIAKDTNKQYRWSGTQYVILSGAEEDGNAVHYYAETKTAAEKAQARANIGAGTSNFSGDYRSLENVPQSFTPSAHAASHAAGGTDPVTVAQSQVTGLGAALGAKRDKTDLKLEEPKNVHWVWSSNDPNCPEGWLAEANKFGAPKPVWVAAIEMWSAANIGGYSALRPELTEDALSVDFYFEQLFLATATRDSATDTTPVLVDEIACTSQLPASEQLLTAEQRAAIVDVENKLAKSDVVKPDADATAGQAADAKDTHDALEKKADEFTEWVHDELPEGVELEPQPYYDQQGYWVWKDSGGSSGWLGSTDASSVSCFFNQAESRFSATRKRVLRTGDAAYVVTDAVDGGVSVKVNGETVTAFADLLAKCKTGRAVLYGQATTVLGGYAFYNAASVTDSVIQFQVSGMLYDKSNVRYGMYVRRIKIVPRANGGLLVDDSGLEGPFASKEYAGSDEFAADLLGKQVAKEAIDERLPIPLVAKTGDFTAESYKRFVVAYMPSAGLTLTMHAPTGTDADVFECRFDGTALTDDASVSFTGAAVTKMEGETDTGVVKAGKVALMSAFWNGATWDVNWKVEG